MPLQACVTQPLKPFLDPIVVSRVSLHVYVSQSPRGELVMGGADGPLYSSTPTRSTRLTFMEALMPRTMLALFPFLAEVQGAAPVGRASPT